MNILLLSVTLFSVTNNTEIQINHQAFEEKYNEFNVDQKKLLKSIQFLPRELLKVSERFENVFRQEYEKCIVDQDQCEKIVEDLGWDGEIESLSAILNRINYDEISLYSSNSTGFQEKLSKTLYREDKGTQKFSSISVTLGGGGFQLKYAYSSQEGTIHIDCDRKKVYKISRNERKTGINIGDESLNKDKFNQLLEKPEVLKAFQEACIIYIEKIVKDPKKSDEQLILSEYLLPRIEGNDINRVINAIFERLNIADPNDFISACGCGCVTTSGLYGKYISLIKQGILNENFHKEVSQYNEKAFYNDKLLPGNLYKFAQQLDLSDEIKIEQIINRLTLNIEVRDLEWTLNFLAKKEISEENQKKLKDFCINYFNQIESISNLCSVARFALDLELNKEIKEEIEIEFYSRFDKLEIKNKNDVDLIGSPGFIWKTPIPSQLNELSQKRINKIKDSIKKLNDTGALNKAYQILKKYDHPIDLNSFKEAINNLEPIENMRYFFYQLFQLGKNIPELNKEIEIKVLDIFQNMKSFQEILLVMPIFNQQNSNKLFNVLTNIPFENYNLKDFLEVLDCFHSKNIDLNENFVNNIYKKLINYVEKTSDYEDLNNLILISKKLVKKQNISFEKELTDSIKAQLDTFQIMNYSDLCDLKKLINNLECDDIASTQIKDALEKLTDLETIFSCIKSIRMDKNTIEKFIPHVKEIIKSSQNLQKISEIYKFLYDNYNTEYPEISYELKEVIYDKIIQSLSDNTYDLLEALKASINLKDYLDFQKIISMYKNKLLESNIILESIHEYVKIIELLRDNSITIEEELKMKGINLLKSKINTNEDKYLFHVNKALTIIEKITDELTEIVIEFLQKTYTFNNEKPSIIDIDGISNFIYLFQNKEGNISKINKLFQPKIKMIVDNLEKDYNKGVTRLGQLLYSINSIFLEDTNEYNKGEMIEQVITEYKKENPTKEEEFFKQFLNMNVSINQK